MKRRNECHTCGDNCNCGNKGGHSHDEGSYMVSQNLNAIFKAVQEIIPLIGEHDNVESWIEHKISVAKAALSDVRDSLAYHNDTESCGGQHGEMPQDGDVEIEILSPSQSGPDQFNLGQMLGSSCQNENKYFLGSGAINEKRQLITNNSNKKIIVEAIKQSGNCIRVKTKSGKEYEYLPHFGVELEMLRCEDYNIRIKK